MNIHFPEGVIGFPDLKNYHVEEDQDGLNCIRSIEDPAIRFYVVNPKDFFPDYTVEIDPDDLGMIGAQADEVTLGAIVCIGRDKTTVNLKGPIIFRECTGYAKQIIIPGDRYNCRHEVTI